jgi:hypothetical protein
MEALATIVFALLAIVLLDAATAIANCLLRWAPSLALGALAARFCFETGAGAVKAAVAGLIAAALARNLMRALADRSIGAGFDD